MFEGTGTISDELTSQALAGLACVVVQRNKGSATLKQTAFGITPVTVKGGTVKVKD